MSDMNALQLAAADQALDAAFRHHQRGECARAVESLNSARKTLLKLARNTGNGTLKQLRLQQADRLDALVRDWAQARPLPAQEVGTPTTGQSASACRFAPEVVDKSITFDSVVGLEDAKREIRLRMVLPFAHREMARLFKVETGGGLLLYGPPGTGKTLLARAAAAELDAAFFAIKASDIMSKWVGEAEKNVEALFSDAGKWERAVIFIDEIEALVPARASNASTVMARVVPQFLAELQGFHERRNTLLVMGATNAPWAIDPAILRPGRFDVQIYVGLPDHMARRRQFEQLLQGRPVANGVDLDRLAQLTEGYSGADITGIVAGAAREAFLASVTGDIQPLGQFDLEKKIGATRPSVSPSQLSRYRFSSANEV